MIFENRVNAGWAAKYPFTKEAREYIKLFAPSIEELKEEDLKHIWEYAFKRAVNSIKGCPLIKWGPEEDELVAVSYPLAMAMVKRTGNAIIFARFANGEAKRAYRLLLHETPRNVIHVAENFNVRTRHLKGDEYEVYFTDYLKVSTKISDKSWKLVNNVLRSGYVLVSQRRMSRIISEYVREYILQKLSESRELEEENLVKLAKELTERFSRKIEKQEYVKVEVDKRVEDFPPCMKRTYEVIVSGGSPSHIARFALTAFMLRVGYKIDEIAKIFSGSADFNEKIARYQIEHIAGERGGKKRYFPPSCEKMKIYNLCFPDEHCKRIKNPIQYILARRKDEKGN